MSEIPRGAIRFNTDSNKPELWDGSQWAEFQLSTPNLGQGSDRQPGPRGIWAGGQSAQSNTIDYINISSTGDATDFGDLTQARLGTSGVASNTRGVIFGGYPYPSAVVNTIEFITISSTGNATDSSFDISGGRTYFSALSNSTRGLSVGGDPSGGGTEINTIEYVTIAALGNAVDFGDLTQARRYLSSCASSVRGVIGGGDAVSPASAYQNTIDFITISTLGNAQDFGDLTGAVNNLTSCSNSTRGLFAGGYQPGDQVNTIEYITITSTGNATNFGDLTVERAGLAACSSPTRAVFCGGYNPSNTNTIDYVTILTQGNAVDFGDRTEAKNSFSGFSNAHGGL